MHVKTIILATILPIGHGFTFMNPTISIRSTLSSSQVRSFNNYNCNRLSATQLSSSKDEEIAALEEKLKRLKEEQQQQEEELIGDPVSEFNESAVVVSSKNTLDEPYTEMLSENWKVSEVANQEDEGNMGGIVKGVVFLALFLGLALFSQVPVGQDNYDKYSTAKPNMSIDLGSWKEVRED